MLGLQPGEAAGVCICIVELRQGYFWRAGLAHCWEWPAWRAAAALAARPSEGPPFSPLACCCAAPPSCFSFSSCCGDTSAGPVERRAASLRAMAEFIVYHRKRISGAAGESLMLGSAIEASIRGAVALGGASRVLLPSSLSSEQVSAGGGGLISRLGKLRAKHERVNDKGRVTLQQESMHTFSSGTKLCCAAAQAAASNETNTQHVIAALRGLLFETSTCRCTHTKQKCTASAFPGCQQLVVIALWRPQFSRPGQAAAPHRGAAHQGTRMTEELEREAAKLYSDEILVFQNFPWGV